MQKNGERQCHKVNVNEKLSIILACFPCFVKFMAQIVAHKSLCYNIFN